MKKVVVMVVALALFGAFTAVASAQGTQPSGGGTVSSGNTQTGSIGQSANAGGDNGLDHRGGTGGNAGNQACLVQQNAGRDANAACNQSQNFSTGTTGVRTGVRGVGVTGLRSSGVSGVSGVTLARTGFDAWILALAGGVALAGGLGLLMAGRRGRFTA
jgi:hypothetical protein